MSEAWEALVERYKGDRTICNCRMAYYADPDGTSYDAAGKPYKNSPGTCQYGCQANQYAVKELIAEGVIDELERLGVTVPVKRPVFVP